MHQSFEQATRHTLTTIETDGLLKTETALSSPQSARIYVDKTEVINLCANNYLGLADHPEIISAAKSALDAYGYGMASVRFICGTCDLHRQLEHRLARCLGTDDVILFASCFDANGGLFEPLLDAEDAIISDSLNHASIIDGIRLCKARRYRYASSDMDSLESQLRQARADGARFIMIATDGVFSMDGHLAKLPEIRALADQFDASLMIDDCHATGFIGPNGAGTAAHFSVRADIITGTLGKALGGAMGGFVAASQPVVDLLRQRSRPYLFSNSLPPSIVAGTLAALDLVEHGDALRSQLRNNTTLWRRLLTDGGFEVAGADHPIMPVMTYDAIKSQKMAARLLELGVFVKGFFYPVVPKGQARIRTQMNARLTQDDLHDAAAKFIQAGRETGVLA